MILVKSSVAWRQVKHEKRPLLGRERALSVRVYPQRRRLRIPVRAAMLAAAQSTLSRASTSAANEASVVASLSVSSTTVSAAA